MRKIDWGQFANYLPAIVAPTVLVTVITATAISVSNIENRGKNAPRAVKPISYKIEKHDVDQVFRDHNGYRVYWDNEDGEVIEKKYYQGGAKNWSHVPNPIIEGEHEFIAAEDDEKQIRIYRDLEAKTQGYANVIHYTINAYNKYGSHIDEDNPLYYVEIHLPEDGKLSPGNETYGLKPRIHDNMSEIK